MSNPGEGLGGETVERPTGRQLMLDYRRAVHPKPEIRRGDPREAGRAVMGRVLELAEREQYAGLELGRAAVGGEEMVVTTEDYLHMMSGRHPGAAELITKFVVSEGVEEADRTQVQGFLDANLGGRPDVAG